MKKILLLVIIALIPAHLFAQADGDQTDKLQTQNNSITTYRLFPTQNMWTFIKLNTRNGQMWQVRFDMKSDNRFVTNLSLKPLVTKDKEVNDRFTLYSTQNIYTFILLDQLEGRTWQVQWSTDTDNRGIIPIE